MRVLVLTAALLLGVSASPAVAATINVTTTSDIVANDGQCSLREAISAANSDSPSGSAVGECPAGTAAGNQIALGGGLYSLTAGELKVTSAVTLVGQSVDATTINANGISRLFEVSSAGNLNVRDLSLIGGRAPDGTAATGTAPAAAGGNGGAILNGGDLTLDHVTISGNHAGAGGVGMAGSAPGDAPGAGGNGGAIESTGPSVAITDSTIDQNFAGGGGNSSGGGPGGGGSAGSGFPIGGNGGSGGGIDASGGSVTITGSTIDGNRAGSGGNGGSTGGVAGNGGGLSLSNDSTSLANDTIVGNSAGNTGFPLPAAGSTSDGGALLQSGGAATVIQVTLAQNNESNSSSCCHDVTSTGGLTVAGSALDGSCAGVIDGGHNVALAGRGCPGMQLADDSSFGLRLLQDNGGPTETMLPRTKSPLIDAVPRGLGCQATDQRGIARPEGKACDAGAVEVKPVELPWDPARLKFGRVKFGHVRRMTVKFTNTGDNPVSLGRGTVHGSGAPSFRIVSNRCRGTTLAPGATCTVVVSFLPHRTGRRSAVLRFVAAPSPLTLTGVGAG